MSRHFSLFVFLGLICGSHALAAPARKTGFTVHVKYEGGTLPVNSGRAMATIGEDEVVFLHGGQRIAIPVRSITAVTCNTDVRRRFGATVLGMVPRMHLDKTESYYIGLTWTGQGTAKSEMVLRLTSADYRDFVTMIERLSGLKAVNPDKVGTVVRYEL